VKGGSQTFVNETLAEERQTWHRTWLILDLSPLWPCWAVGFKSHWGDRDRRAKSSRCGHCSPGSVVARWLRNFV